MTLKGSRSDSNIFSTYEEKKPYKETKQDKIDRKIEVLKKAQHKFDDGERRFTDNKHNEAFGLDSDNERELCE
jgi:hypothetical protein